MSRHLPLDPDGTIRKFAALMCFIIAGVSLLGTAYVLWGR